MEWKLQTYFAVPYYQVFHIICTSIKTRIVSRIFLNYCDRTTTTVEIVYIPGKTKAYCLDSIFTIRLPTTDKTTCKGLCFPFSDP